MLSSFFSTDPLQTKKVRKVPPGLPSSVSAHHLPLFKYIHTHAHAHTMLARLSFQHSSALDITTKSLDTTGGNSFVLYGFCKAATVYKKLRLLMFVVHKLVVAQHSYANISSGHFFARVRARVCVRVCARARSGERTCAPRRD